MLYLKTCHRKTGAALVAVVLAMVVLSLLLVSLLGISLAESKHSIRSEQSLKAFYHAKAAALAAADYLKTNRESTAVKGIYNNADPTTILNGTYENGTASVTATGPDADTIMVSSTWTSGTAQGRMKVQLQKNVPPPIAGKNGIQSKTTIHVNNPSSPNVVVDSNLAAYESNVILQDPPFHFTDADSFESPEAYLATFPTIAPWNPPVPATVYNINNSIANETIIDNTSGVNKDWVYIHGGVNIQGNGKTLTIKTNTEMFIRIDGDFTLKGQGGQDASLVLIGSKRVHILVNGSLNLGGNCVNQLNQVLGPEMIVFYVPASGSNPETRSVVLRGTANISTTIVAPDLNMTTQGNPTFSGMSWVNSFDGGGSITYIQDPLPDNALEDGFFQWPLQITGYSE